MDTFVSSRLRIQIKSTAGESTEVQRPFICPVVVILMKLKFINACSEFTTVGEVDSTDLTAAEVFMHSCPQCEVSVYDMGGCKSGVLLMKPYETNQKEYLCHVNS